MNATIGIYDNHDLAVDAVKKLKEHDYHMSKLTIMGKMEDEAVDQDLHIITKNPIKVAGVATGTTVGTVLGVLMGIGIFSIPGLGFLYGAGALVGAIAGFDFGLLGGGIASVLATVGVKDENAKKYHDALNAGKYLVIVHGTQEDMVRAKAILHEHGTHNDITSH